MGGRYDIMQRIKEMLEASDPLKYGDAEQSRSIEVGPSPELSPDPRIAALSTPLMPSIEPPPPIAMSPPPVVAPSPPVNVPPPPPMSAPPPPVAGAAQGQTELVQLLREGRKIMAVKRYRELTGVGLAEAKAAVDQLEQQLGAGDDADLPPVSPEWVSSEREAMAAQVVSLVQRGNKIEAIRLYREAARVSLHEAKEAVDAIEDRLRQERTSVAAASPSPSAAPPPAPPAARRGGRPMPAWMQPVVEHLNRGNKIGAIKAYRDATGVGLAEAKATVEALERQLANEGR
jgi:ribosomal protein L7/L12